MGKFEILDIINSDDLYKISISNPFSKSNQVKHIIGRPIIIKNRQKFQFEIKIDPKVTHINIDKNDLVNYIIEKLVEYKQIFIFGKIYEYQIIVRKDKSFKINKNKNKNKLNEKNLMKKPHNLGKNYILNEGDKIPIFIELGIFTQEYKVVRAMYDKFKQINRFVELVDDVVKKVFAERKKIRILDFGCGKSYLTFVLYYYFEEVLNKEVEIIGIDLKEEVINKCISLAQKYQYKGLKFIKGDVSLVNNQEFRNEQKTKIDMVVSLHACDTATDYALLNAIKWHTDVIFSVPCCQHELNNQIGKEKLPVMLKHGIIKERFSAMLTDSIRCCLLNICDYKADLIEFVDIAHSPKNLLIRAYKTKQSEKYKALQYQELNDIINNFKIKQTLHEELKKNNFLHEDIANKYKN